MGDVSDQRTSGKLLGLARGWRFWLRGALPVGVTATALAIAASRVDFGELAAMTSRFSAADVALTALALAAGMFLACLRLKIVARDFGHPMRLGDAIVAATSGQLAGTFFFQVFGQTIARSLVLSKVGVAPSATLLLTGYERVVAALVSVALAIAGLLYLFGGVSFDAAAGGLDFLKVAAGIAAVAAAGGGLVWGKPLALWMRTKLGHGAIWRLARVFALSILIQIGTMVAYVLVAHRLAPGTPLAHILAASSIVMLAASVPISFAGWGVREVSAIYALGAIQMPNEAALLVALVIGLASIAVTALLAIVGTAIRRDAAPLQADSVRASRSNIAASSVMNWAIPLFAASAVFFQVFVPIGTGKLNVNFADSIVLFGGGIFALRLTAKGAARPDSMVPGIERWTALASAAMALALLHGWAAYGWIDWAFVNRGFGWVVLLAYAATGALIVQGAGAEGRRLFLATFVVAGLAATSIDLGLFSLRLYGLNLPSGLVGPRVAGFAQNPTALAFQLLLAIAAVVALRWKGIWLRLALALTLSALFFAGSRAAAGAVVVVLGAALWLGFIRLRDVLAAATLALALTVVLSGAPLGWLGGPGGERNGLMTFLNALNAGTPTSTVAHWETIMSGWRMFLDHPIFGAGLGVFYATFFREHGYEMVIHSVPVWLLAESGIVGLAAFLAPFFALLREGLRTPTSADPSRVLMILSLLAFAVMGSVHEMLYQRALWLLLGAALVAVPRPTCLSVATAMPTLKEA